MHTIGPNHPVSGDLKGPLIAPELRDSMRLHIGAQIFAPRRSGSGGSSSTSSGNSIFEKSVTWVAGGNPVNPIGALQGMIHIPFTCALKQIFVSCLGGSGSCTFELWKAASGSHYPPVITDDMTGGANVSLSALQFKVINTFVGWTTSCAADDMILLTLTGSSVFTAIQATLRFQ